jgi:hypothetical protein
LYSTSARLREFASVAGASKSGKGLITGRSLEMLSKCKIDGSILTVVDDAMFDDKLSLNLVHEFVS